ncbi:MAG: D-amino acid aminotransferase [Oligoflexia bacterium]|nr:D-amino acid aminotransferase [Oligoflexia bacterium]
MTKSTSEKSLVNSNGKIVKREDATVSIFDRGFLFGDSIYEVTHTYDQVPFHLEEHLDRLENSARGIGMDLEFSKDFLKKEIDKTCQALGLPRQYLRIIITRGEGEIGLDPALSQSQNFFIIAKELPEYPKRWYEKGLSVIIAQVIRNPKKSIDPNVKSGNYLNNVMAMQQAKEMGADDAVMLNHKGQVTECTTSNIWIIQGQKIMTPPLQAGLLGGITRKALLALGKKHGLDMIESNFTADSLKQADEAFITSSTKEIVPITKIDGKNLGSGNPGEVTKKLTKLYQDYVRETISSYKS